MSSSTGETDESTNRLGHDDPVPEVVQETLSEYQPLLQRLLYNRGITDAESAQVFLSPDYALHTHSSRLLKDAETAAERILKAVANGEKIVVFSDFDTDGIPGAVVLADTLEKIGATEFSVVIPERNREGFGLKETHIDSFVSDEVDLVVTIDCGITAIEPVKQARENGIDVIITDHHLPGDELPDAVAIVNPKQSVCEYPFKELCGAAVIFKVCEILLEDSEVEVSEGWEKWLLDMVGIATISDMVPLVGENRVLANYGLIVLQKSRRPGIKALVKRARVKQRQLDESDVGFSIGPRLNAASRMGHAMDAFDLLRAKKQSEAKELAATLEKLNNQRKGVVAGMVKQARKHLENRELGEVIVVGAKDWQPSLCGLVATRLSSEYERPVFVWGNSEDGEFVGSCRSGAGVHVVELMKALDGSGVFSNFGGHAKSGGFALLESNAVHTLEQKLCGALEANRDELVVSDETTETIAELSFGLPEVDWELHHTLENFAPFGVGNEQPTLLIETVTVTGVDTFGKTGAHLKLLLEGGRQSIEAIAFFKSADEFSYQPKEGEAIHLYGYLEKDTFGYNNRLRFRIADIRENKN